MKRIITTRTPGNFEFKIGQPVIASNKINTRGIIVLKSYNTIGILTKHPESELWFFTDISNAWNTWPGSLKRSPQESIDIFGPGDEIYQFDTLKEFSDWLVKELQEREGRIRR